MKLSKANQALLESYARTALSAGIAVWVSGNHDLATPMLAARSAGWQILGVRTVSLWHLNQALHEDCTSYIGPVRFEIFA